MNEELYQTYDLALASYLVASGTTQLTDITSQDGTRKFFCFTPAPTKEQLIQFYSGEATVSAKKFAETYATLKGAGYTMKEYA